MPYRRAKDLPANLKKILPKHAQDIFRKAYNNASDQYSDPDKRRGAESRETAARRVAWAAVKKEYKKSEKTGKWQAK